MTSGQTVYASADALYVATERWVAPDAVTREIAPAPSDTVTEIHRFEAGAAASTEYTGSGRVPGHMLSQWSMSEHHGHLRVASTTAPPWTALADEVPASRSFVTVLETEGEKLDEVGRTEALGVSEQIYAVRFIGDVGFVVTFRQVDPLYTLDLSDPGNPQAVGELKIPGYSAYLHPVGDGLLLGVGQAASASGIIRGSQVSLFDVSDLGAPELLDRLSLGAGTSSEIELDHHAFTYDESRGLAVVPSTGWAPAGLLRSRGATGIAVSEGSLRPVGSAQHPAGGHRGQVRRSLALGDSLLTYSDRGVALHDPATLERESWARFDPTG